MRKQVSAGKYRTFMPIPEVQQRLELAGKVGINVSEMINEILKENLERATKARIAKLQKELERAKGFEPSTLTLATCQSQPVLQLKFVARRIAHATHAPAVRESADLPDRSGHAKNVPSRIADASGGRFRRHSPVVK